MQNIFIAGTGTGIGKTVVSAAIAYGLQQKGLRVAYWKPVSSGTPNDSETIAKMVHQLEIFPSSFSYREPLAPHIAAVQDGKPEVNIHTLEVHWRDLQNRDAFDVLLIEAAGGVLVPLNDEMLTWLDFLGRVDELKVMLVAASGLGTLNHTAMSVRCFKDSGFRVRGIIMSGAPFHDNELTVRRMDRAIPVVSFDECPELTANPEWEKRCCSLAQFVSASLSDPAEDQQWQEWDRDLIWHPFTQHQTATSPEMIVGASGVWLKTSKGRKLLDAVGSWWTNIIGHGREVIARQCAAQIRTCDHVAFAGLTHEPAACLAHEIVTVAGGHFDKVFFSDNGSTAVEVATKIAFQYQRNRGQGQRDLFLTFRGGYHGDTIGTMALSNNERFHGHFQPLLFKTVNASPVTKHSSPICPNGDKDFDKNLDELAKVVDQHQERICAMIVEPLIQGAGGMLVQDSRWLPEVAKIANEQDIPLIFDEVFTGCGRTGEFFAFQRAQVVPDIICLAKGLTGGSLPLAMTLCKERFYRSFLDDSDDRAFMHGHTYTANPISCRAALTTLEILTKEGLVAKALELEKCFTTWLKQNDGRISNPRALGAMLAFEIATPTAGIANEIRQLGMQHGIFLRPLNNTIYFVPPLVIDESELAVAFKAFEKIITRGC